MKTAYLIFLLVVSSFLSAQETASHINDYFDKEWNEASIDNFDYVRTIRNEVELLTNGDSIYPYEIRDKKHQLRFKGYVNNPDSPKYVYFNKEYSKKGKLGAIWVRKYQHYGGLIPTEIKPYYAKLEPFLKDTFIHYSPDFDLQVAFRKKDIPKYIVVMDAECGCAMSYLWFSKKGNIQAFNDKTDNKINGRKYTFYENGQIKRKTYYLDGDREGKWVRYYPDGSIKAIESYQNDKWHGPWERYRKNGIPKYKRNYFHGKQDGEYIRYFKNGNPRYIKNYKNNKLHGPFTRFYENGNIQYTGKMKHGKRDKTWTYNKEDGTQKYIRVFDADRVGD